MYKDGGIRFYIHMKKYSRGVSLRFSSANVPSRLIKPQSQQTLTPERHRQSAEYLFVAHREPWCAMSHFFRAFDGVVVYPRPWHQILGSWVQ